MDEGKEVFFIVKDYFRYIPPEKKQTWIQHHIINSALWIDDENRRNVVITVAFVKVFTVNKEFDTTYEMYFNFNAPNYQNVYKKLSEQKYIAYHFFDEHGKEKRGVKVSNDYCDSIKRAMVLIEKFAPSPWSMKEFDLAKELFQKTYTMEELLGMDDDKYLEKINAN